jgi:hypothetical protein
MVRKIIPNHFMEVFTLLFYFQCCLWYLAGLTLPVLCNGTPGQIFILMSRA